MHAKVCVIDDVWMMVGSDNLNRRSWTNDSELSCAVLDDEHDEREPRDPAGLGDGARRLARDTRLRLWREHLDRDDDDDADLVDLERGVDALLASAHALDAWHEGRRRGPRPAGRLRVHGPSRYRNITRGGRTRCTERSSIPTVVRPRNGAGSGTDRRVAQPGGG